jgi:anti-sigma B factor antagonist
MSMKLTTHEEEGVLIVDTSGRLTLGEATAALRTKLRELVDGGSRRILMNMADVSFIDSSGLGELVSAHTTITAAGGQIKLLNLAKRAHDLLKITKLYTVFETFEDETTAIRSFVASTPTQAPGLL